MQTLRENTTLQSGKYRIIKVLGQGGFGITYLAEQVMLGRKVAIKEFFYKECCDREDGTSHVTLGTQSNRETVQRFMNKFLKEARTISQLDHPNIIKIHDIFEENNTAYYVMEYIEGENLSEMVKRQGALPEATAVAYIKKVADALAYIHARSINHLDVKPGNIMYNRSDNQIILIDFGLSKQYDDVGSQTSSTPVGISQGFAPIEQYRAGGVAQFTPQTDIYALGATLYWLIVGKTPPAADEVLSDGISMPTSISSNLYNAIEEAMKPNKNARPKNIQAFINILTKKVVPSPKVQTSNEETQIIGAPSKKSGTQKQTPLQSGSSNNGSSAKWLLVLLILGVISVFIYLIVQNNTASSSYQSNQQDVYEMQENEGNNTVSSVNQDSRSSSYNNTNTHPQDDARPISDPGRVLKTSWVENQKLQIRYPSVFVHDEFFIEDDVVFGETFSWRDVQLCFLSIGTWGTLDKYYPIKGSPLSSNTKIKEITYRAASQDIHSGKTTDGRIFYLHRRIERGVEVDEPDIANILVLLYPETYKDDIKPLIDMVKNWSYYGGYY